MVPTKLFAGLFIGAGVLVSATAWWPEERVEAATQPSSDSPTCRCVG